MCGYAGKTRFCNIFENFQNKNLKRRIGEPGEWCFGNLDTVSVANQWTTLVRAEEVN